MPSRARTASLYTCGWDWKLNHQVRRSGLSLVHLRKECCYNRTESAALYSGCYSYEDQSERAEELAYLSLAAPSDASNWPHNAEEESGHGKIKSAVYLRWRTGRHGQARAGDVRTWRVTSFGSLLLSSGFFDPSAFFSPE